jgi:hypothetical protein
MFQAYSAIDSKYFFMKTFCFTSGIANTEVASTTSPKHGGEAELFVG